LCYWIIGCRKVYAAKTLKLSLGKVVRYSKVNKKIKHVIGKAMKTKRVNSKIYTYDVFLVLKTLLQKLYVL
jgi:hypothetical protein